MGIVFGIIGFLFLFLIFMFDFWISPKDVKGLWKKLKELGLSPKKSVMVVLVILIALFLGWMLFNILIGRLHVEL